MNFSEKNNSEVQKNSSPEDDNILNDIDALYMSAEKQRIKQAILKTDTDKFLLFTRMLRINSMLKNANVIHKNS
jgi:hypothetical protein